ncbi:MAG: ATP-dependent zinc metalloprotease FtsH [Candidatus Nealsonbacteria bacterium]|nr:ATP-dependent zinc metalloprotease FtsH [Candidatus Nealsonbacteria bacterium]
MKYFFKNLIFIFLIFLIIAGIYTVVFRPAEHAKEISLTELATKINAGQVKEIIIIGSELQITYQEAEEYLKAISRKEIEISLLETLINLGVSPTKLKELDIIAKEEKGIGIWLGPVLLLLFPLLLFGLFFFFIFRQAKAGAMQAFNFSKARIKLFGAEGHPKEKITFKDVAGLKEAKQELMEVVDFLKNPKKYLQMGAKIPRGVLLLGPPGTGKTLLARAVAGQANAPFFSISGSEFIELFVGIGSSRVRDLFSTAKKAAPAIIFIDELDAIGRIRGTGIGGGHDEREQTLNQILVEMDGFERDTNVIIISATNRGDVLDPALLRPGRFDRKVILDIPDINDREEILKIHSQGKPLSLDVKLREVAERTPGFSGADLANVVNEAAILAARKNKQQVFQEELLESIEKVLLGPERKSHILSKTEKEIAAFHEAGHALVSANLPQTEPIRKISIIARGAAAGYTLKMPSEERKIKTKTAFLSEIATLLGGFCAEKLKFNEITTGATNDLERASYLARKLVKEYGMSCLGPISFGEKEELVFLGREISEQKNYSEKVSAQIDKEVTKFIKNAEIQANQILIKKKKLLERIARTLITKEIIEKEEFEGLIKKKKTETLEKPILQKSQKKESIKVKIKRVTRC